MPLSGSLTHSYWPTSRSLTDMILTVFDTELLPTDRVEDHALFYAMNQHKPIFNLNPYALTVTRIDELDQ